MCCLSRQIDILLPARLPLPPLLISLAHLLLPLLLLSRVNLHFLPGSLLIRQLCIVVTKLQLLSSSTISLNSLKTVIILSYYNEDVPPRFLVILLVSVYDGI